MSRIPRSFSGLQLATSATFVVTAALVFVATRYASLSRQLSEDTIASMRKDQRVFQLEGDLREANRLLRSIPIADVRIQGDTVLPETGPPLAKDVDRQLIVVISRLCRVCSASLPLLDSIERKTPGMVVGVSFGDDRKSIEEYSRSHRLRFPIIVAPKGDLVARLPRHATPVFLLRDESYVKGVDIGLTTASRERLSQLAQ